MSSRTFTPRTATAVIVANMIGTGVFTSLGFQLLDIQSTPLLLGLWIVGGVTALCGAMSYAELGAALPRSGGEYNFLTHIYHPAAGFVSGWVSATVGFAAATALAAVTFGHYLGAVFDGLPAASAAGMLVVVLTVVHARSREDSSRLQNVFTSLKIVLIMGFCLSAWLVTPQPQTLTLGIEPGAGASLGNGAFAVALIYVSYAYSGWNAATYLSGEIADPQRNLPRILGVGTAVVMLLYVALNWAFLYAAPMDALRGEVEVGYVAARYIFGTNGAALMGVVLAALLVSTVSAMTMAGPRVLHVIGQDFYVFRFLGRSNANGVPHVAIYFQGAIALVYIATATFESILVFAGFVLALNTFLTVLGLFVLRIRQPELARPYRTWGYPLTPLVFLGFTGWTLIYVFLQKPRESLLGLSLIAAGIVVYLLVREPAATNKAGD